MSPIKRSPAPGTHQLGPTWLEPEHLTYPRGGFSRRACVRLRQNPHNPIVLAYGELRIVRASIPDTFSTIPARLTYRGRQIKGYVSIDTAAKEYTFTPEADPDGCTRCVAGAGCKQEAK